MNAFKGFPRFIQIMVALIVVIVIAAFIVALVFPESRVVEFFEGAPAVVGTPLTPSP
ncbi:MAG: hypothetical protein AAFV33_22380 [Chloroflexota bacterium]